MSEGPPLTRRSTRQGRQRSYLVSTPLPEELIGGAPHLASTTNPHAPLAGYGYGSPTEKEAQPHTQLVSLLEAGWMLDAWDKLPPPQHAPYVDAALAEMGHGAGTALARPCAAPASPPPLLRPRQGAARGAESAAAAAAVGLQEEAGTGAAEVQAAPDGEDAAGGLLALSLLSAVPSAALHSNLQPPPDSCAGASCPSRGSSTGSGGSAATKLAFGGADNSHSSISSPARGAGMGEPAGSEEAQLVAAEAERQQRQHEPQQEWQRLPRLLQALQGAGRPELLLRLQAVSQWQQQQQQQQQQQYASLQHQHQHQHSQAAPLPHAMQQAPRTEQHQQLPWLHAAQQEAMHPPPQQALPQLVSAVEAPQRAPTARQAEQPPPKRRALQAASEAVPRLSLPAAAAAAAVKPPAAGVPAHGPGEAVLQQQHSGSSAQCGSSALTRPSSTGPSISEPSVASGAEDGCDDGAEGDAAAAAAEGMEEDGEEEEEGGGESGGGGKRERKREPPRYRVKDVTLEILEQEGCFNMTQVEAARHLGFGSPTSIKAIMKRLGILKWPYRKKSTIGKMLGNMEEFVRRYCEPGIVEKVLLRAREAYQELEVYEKCTTGAPPPLAEELRALRQKVYKLKDQDKHGTSEDSMRRCVAQLVGKIMMDAAAVRGA
ncbi:hypothetical protein ABPG75_007285 [Micractinium tetrahymenae]